MKVGIWTYSAKWGTTTHGESEVNTVVLQSCTVAAVHELGPEHYSVVAGCLPSSSPSEERQTKRKCNDCIGKAVTDILKISLLLL